MAWIRTFEENEARGLLSWVYRVARWTRGRVPNIVKVSSLNPRLLVTLGPLFRTLMEGPSPLTRAQRKMVAIVASRVNNQGVLPRLKAAPLLQRRGPAPLDSYN